MDPLKKTDSNVILVRRFFDATMEEIRALPPSDREELGTSIRESLPDIPAQELALG